MRRLVIVPVLAAVVVLVRRLAARSNTQVHRINRRSRR
jgi:hypothetical protein